MGPRGDEPCAHSGRPGYSDVSDRIKGDATIFIKHRVLRPVSTPSSMYRVMTWVWRHERHQAKPPRVFLSLGQEQRCENSKATRITHPKPLSL